MIPWNFWYYPFADSEKELTAWGSKVLQPIQKYEKAFGRDNVMKWELAFHADPTKTRKDWEGHCHLAAPASILFVRPPDDGREVRGQKFTCEELKYFATEFVGRFGLAERPWQLPSPHPKARTGKFVERKPSEAPKEFGQRDVLIDMLLEIRKALRLNGRAVVMDLRHNKGIEHTQVWNQAIFAYQTTYAQPDVSDLTLIDGITTLFANEDAINPDGTGKGVPADVWSDTNGHVFYDFKAHRESKHRYTLRFSHSGGIETESSDNAWTYAKHDGTDTFAPRHIVLVEPPAKKVILDQGNVRIHPEHVMELLTLREKFK
jgi:hypothetical protein